MAAPTFHSGVRPLDEEFSYRVASVEGALPDWLRGTFFRNGPGRLEVGGQRFGHWFDGDGLICRFSFRDDGVHFANRYVRTPKFLRETARHGIDCRGFGTQRPGGVLANALRMPANPANTGVIWHGGYLLALNEGGRPFRLDPASLETLGEFNYDGALSPRHLFSAHGKVHPRTGHYVNFGLMVDGIGRHGIRTSLAVYRITPAGRLDHMARIPLDHFPFCHDFALTDRHAIFFLNSIRVTRLGAILLGLRTMADSIAFDARAPMEILVVDLEHLSVVQRTRAAPGAVVHFGNAWETGNEIQLDAMYTDNFDVNNKLKDIWHADRLGGGRFMRYTLSTARDRLAEHAVGAPECEFPQWDSRRSGTATALTYVAAVAPNGNDSFFNAIACINSQSGHAAQQVLPAGCFASEPMFVPRPGGEAEDDGVLLDVIYNANTGCSELWVLDAADIRDVLARVMLPHHIPHQFHGHFTPSLF